MEDTTPKNDSLPEEQGTGSADGEGAVSSSSVDSQEDVANIKDVLGEALGKEFKTDEDALKSVKDTFSYVGKLGQEIKELRAKVEGSQGETKQETKTEIPSEDFDTSKFVSREEFEEATFFAKNPDYANYRDIIKSLRATTGKSYDEVVGSDNFKSIYEKAKAHEEEEKAKSVLQTNPRLGQVTDKMKDARELTGRAQEALSKGDLTTSVAAQEAAKKAAMDALMETLDNQ